MLRADAERKLHDAEDAPMLVRQRLVIGAREAFDAYSRACEVMGCAEGPSVDVQAEDDGEASP
jgi:hypothetical protein